MRDLLVLGLKTRLVRVEQSVVDRPTWWRSRDEISGSRAAVIAAVELGFTIKILDGMVVG